MCKTVPINVKNNMKERVLSIKGDLPPTKVYRKEVFELYAKTENEVSSNIRLNNILAGLITDEDITIYLEKVAKEFQRFKTKINA